MPNQQQIRETITQQIIETLEQGGVPPWRRPWQVGPNSGAPANVHSKRLYRGLNPLLLSVHAARHGLSSKWYGTFQQWQALGGRVMRRPGHVPEGQWGCQIVYWSPVTKTVRNDRNEDEPERFFVLRLYTVFSVDQVDGTHLDHLRAGQAGQDDAPAFDYQPADTALDAAVSGMGVALRYGGTRAYYDARRDLIQLPPKATFESPNEFFATAFHECVHATEHPTRLDWSRKNQSNSYALGELIAELGGVFLCRELGVPASEDMSNHIAYLGGWLREMRNDPRFIFIASAQASKAASYLLGFSRPDVDVPETEGEMAVA